MNLYTSKHFFWRTFLFIFLFTISPFAKAQEKLIYHTIRTDNSGNIIPWFNENTGTSFDRVVNLVWNFWDTMRRDYNGLPYYMNHQVWNAYYDDPRGIGGDQFAMALSSWGLYYAYSGNENVKEDMKFIAEYYLTHGMSAANAAWPDIPYPYNTYVYSGIYDGDMILGRNFTQPDKAGSFGIELLRLYKLNSNERYPNVTDNLYMEAAIKIANTLATKVKEGDENTSPLPFKVNAITGETGVLKSYGKNGKVEGLSSYTTNWSGTLELLIELQKLKKGNVELYKSAFDTILKWMKKYPLQTNKWGPFFEDISGWSDTQINAVTFAQFMMNHPEYFSDWKTRVKKIFDWVYEKLGNKSWEKYGVIVINEQTAYQTPGNSHSSRQASAQLQYTRLTGDTSYYTNAVRQLIWATYMVNDDGRNQYPQDENWLTDGYGDYVRHYLRSMADAPELAPYENHLLSSTSVVQQAMYRGEFYKYHFLPLKDTTNVLLSYRVYDAQGEEAIRLRQKPSMILFDDNLKENLGNSFEWKPLATGGILKVKRLQAHSVTVLE
ncbi:MAG: hypothetical protein ABI691_08575 [Ginsengibacter sp.]